MHRIGALIGYGWYGWTVGADRWGRSAMDAWGSVMDTSPTGERRQRRMPGGRTERIVVRVDPDTLSHLKLRAISARRSLPAYLVDAGLRPLIAGTSGMSLAGQRAMAEQLDTVLTRLRQSGNLLNQIAAKLHSTGQLHGGVHAVLDYHRQTLDQLAALVLSRAEIERAHRTLREPARRNLAHRVRAAAAAAGTEAAFPAELRRCGVLVEPRMSGGQVVGYRVALPADDNETLWLSGSQLARDLSLPRLRTRWEVRGAHWDRLAIRAWQRAREPRPLPGPKNDRDLSHWEAAQRALVNATDTIERLEPSDAAGWTQHLGHTADLVAVLSQRLEPEPGPLYHAGHHLARAAQPDRAHRHPHARPGSQRPILLEVARLVARSGDPTQAAAIASVVLLAYGLVRLLDHLATHAIDRAQRRQLQLASARLAEHPHVANHPATGAARQATAAGRTSITAAGHLHRARHHQPTRPAGRPR